MKWLSLGAFYSFSAFGFAAVDWHPDTFAGILIFPGHSRLSITKRWCQHLSFAFEGKSIPTYCSTLCYCSFQLTSVLMWKSSLSWNSLGLGGGQRCWFQFCPTIAISKLPYEVIVHKHALGACSKSLWRDLNWIEPRVLWPQNWALTRPLQDSRRS